MIAHLTSNEYWGGLNRRFDRRAKLLRRLGFKYETTEYGGVFVRAKPWRTKKEAIPAAVVSLADKRAWVEHLIWAGVRRGTAY